MRIIKKSRREKSEGFLAFFTFPLAFFLLGITIMYITIMPIIKPALKFSNIMVLNQKPNFETVNKDLFENVKEEELIDTSDSISISPDQMPVTGQRYGQLKIQDLDINVPIYYGDTDAELLQGIGTYAEAYLPGSGHTVLMTGHNNLYFFNLGNAKAGDIIQIDTNYGKYEYEIVETKVTTNEDTTAYDLKSQEENLVLYTCYPLDSIGITNERYFVYAKYVKGPKLELIY